MHIKQKKRTSVIASFCIVLVSLLLIGGALAYIYITTDETVFPSPAVSLNDQALTYDTVDWNTPVFDGLLYKRCSAAVDKAVTMPVFTEPMFVLRAPAEYTAELTVRDPQGTVMTAEQQPGEFKFRATRNGTYTYELTLSLPQMRGKAYGTLRYSGRFSLEVQPKISLSAETVTQGDILSVLVSGMEGMPVPEMVQNLSTAQFAKLNTGYAAVIGVGYNVTPGNYVVDVSCGDLRTTKTITVLPGEFERQDLTIDGDVAASTNSAAAAAEWRGAIWPLYETADETIHWQGSFLPPLHKMELNTTYGLYRYTNGSATAERHAGIDLDGETGDTVYAAGGGRVVFADFLTMTGNTVVIEHGAGLKSYYFHMDSLACQKDAMVTAGDVIGTVGSTGYSTGPHLHFEMKIGKQSINPMPLFEGLSSLSLIS